MDANQPAQPDRIIYIYVSPYGGAIVYSNGHLHYSSDVDRHGDPAPDVADGADVHPADGVHTVSDGDTGADTASSLSNRQPLATVAQQMPRSAAENRSD